MEQKVGIDMNKFPSFSSDLQLIERLVAEESVFCLPGQCFDYPNFMRAVLTVPKELTIEACMRMAVFFKRHYVLDKNNNNNRKKSDSRIFNIDSQVESKERIIINLPPVAGT